MRKFLPVLTGVVLLCLPALIDAQTLNLGSIANFSAFSGTGAISNTGMSSCAGDLGTDLGLISGFGPPSTSGNANSADAITVQAKIDLYNLYINLCKIPLTNTTHAAAFGSGETITAGVYNIALGGTVAGNLILDGQGDANAIFVMRFEGAFAAGAGTIITLLNGSRSCNVFWIAEGGISIGASSNIKGTLLAHPGAVALGALVTVEGRMFTTEGAITFNSNNVTAPTGSVSEPIYCNNTYGNVILGTAANFALFSSAGAVSNAGSSGFIGAIGSDAGTISGFSSSVITGSVHNADAVTAQAKSDLAAAYTQLMNMPVTNAVHAGVFGNGETITPGVYAMGGAGSIAGVLTLDGQGDPNASFIFRFGGALNTGAQSKVKMINGVNYANVYWISEGAIGMGTFTFMKGNLIAHNGANNMAANGNVEGRMFSTLGDVAFSTGVIYPNYNPCLLAILPVATIAFAGNCENEKTVLKWSTATETGNKAFSVEKKSIDETYWQLVGTVAGAGNSQVVQNYRLTDNMAVLAATCLYRLKQTDVNGNFKYSNTIIVKNCSNQQDLSVSFFPNPTTGIVNKKVSGVAALASHTEVFTVQGVKIYQSATGVAAFDLSAQAPGIYLLRTVVNSTINISTIVKVNK